MCHISAGLTTCMGTPKEGGVPLGGGNFPVQNPDGVYFIGILYSHIWKYCDVGPPFSPTPSDFSSEPCADRPAVVMQVLYHVPR